MGDPMGNPPAAYEAAPDPALRCPSCASPLVRVRRTPWDRLVSLVSPRRRYRCRGMGCGWEGTLRDKS
jgi:hypothetical protein